MPVAVRKQTLYDPLPRAGCSIRTLMVARWKLLHEMSCISICLYLCNFLKLLHLPINYNESCCDRFDPKLLGVVKRLVGLFPKLPLSFYFILFPTMGKASFFPLHISGAKRHCSSPSFTIRQVGWTHGWYCGDNFLDISSFLVPSTLGPCKVPEVPVYYQTAHLKVENRPLH